jgi:hypothetical protein
MDAQALGRYLRETREARELTLEQAEQTLKIRRRILEAFELGQFTFSDMTPVQVRGFIRNYAVFLGLEEDRVVGYYEAARHEAQNPRQRSNKRRTQTAAPVAPRSITDTNPSLPAVPVMLDRSTRRQTLINALVRLLVAVASIAVIAFVVYQLIGESSLNQNDNAPNGDILGQLPPTLTSTPIPTSTPPRPAVTAGATPLQQNYSGSGVLVTIIMTQRSWLRISSDGVTQFAGLARPGERLPDISGQENVTVTASNAEGLHVIYNGEEQPIFGGRGQKVDIVFTINGAQVSSGPGFEPTLEFSPTPPPTSNIDVAATIAALTPSATPGPSPTPTNTLPPTDTPTYTPTITLTPSITPTPSDTPTATLTPTITPTPSLTAVLPPRVTQEGLPPTKPPG